MKLDISAITIDENLYPRKDISLVHVNRLAHAILAGAKLPPITIEAGTRRLVDGRHRVEAHKQLDMAQITVSEKVYKSEADLFADAVRLNIGHGEALDHYSVQNAIIRLEQYGYAREQISEIVRLPFDRIDKIRRGFAVSETGEPLAVKGGLPHLRGETLSDEQQAVNRRYSGGKATFHARQLRELIANGIWPKTAAFRREMDELTALWLRLREEEEAAAA